MFEVYCCSCNVRQYLSKISCCSLPPLPLNDPNLQVNWLFYCLCRFVIVIVIILHQFILKIVSLFLYKCIFLISRRYVNNIHRKWCFFVLTLLILDIYVYFTCVYTFYILIYIYICFLKLQLVWRFLNFINWWRCTFANDFLIFT